MMPAQNKTNGFSAPAVEQCDMKELSSFNAKGEENQIFPSIDDASNPSGELLGVSNYETCDIIGSNAMCQILSNRDNSVSNLKSEHLCGPDISSNIISFEISESFPDKSLQNDEPAPLKLCTKKSMEEIQTLSLKQMRLLLENVSCCVEAVSSELVQLLLENDALQQESDARNIAIEQLLKLTVKNNESEPKPIQMSLVTTSDDESDAN